MYFKILANFSAIVNKTGTYKPNIIFTLHGFTGSKPCIPTKNEEQPIEGTQLISYIWQARTSANSFRPLARREKLAFSICTPRMTEQIHTHFEALAYPSKCAFISHPTHGPTNSLSPGLGTTYQAWRFRMHYKLHFLPDCLRSLGAEFATAFIFVVRTLVQNHTRLKHETAYAH